MKNKSLNKSSSLFEKNLVVAVDFHKKFKDVDIGPFSFNIEKGKVTALLGSSGSGKSVFLNSLLGATLSYDGNIYIKGKERKSASSIENNAHVGFYSQMDFSLYSISALNFLKNMCNVMGLDMNIADSKIEYWLKKFDLWAAKDKPLNAFSWGMKNRMNLILCFIKEPEILILDEPGANLDSKWRSYIYKILNDFKNESECTIVITVHNIDEVYDIIDNFVVLEKGQLIFSGTKEELNLYKKLKLSFNNNVNIEDVEKQLNQNNILTFELNQDDNTLVVGLQKEQSFNQVQMVLNKCQIETKNIVVQPININEIQKALKDKTLAHIPKYQPVEGYLKLQDQNLVTIANLETKSFVPEELLNEPDPTHLEPTEVEVAIVSNNKKSSTEKLVTNKSKTPITVEEDLDILKRINKIKERLKVN